MKKLLLALLLFITPTVFGFETMELDYPQIREQMYNPVARVTVYGNHIINDKPMEIRLGTGSAVAIWSDRGITYLISNWHVIEGTDRVEITFFNGIERRIPAQVIRYSVFQDLSLLLIEEYNAPVAKICHDDSEARIGEIGYSVGAGNGLDPFLTVGVVGNANTKIPRYRIDDRWSDKPLKLIQHSAQILGGNSGGPFYLKRGNNFCVMGINAYSLLRAAHVSYAIDHKVLNAFIKGNHSYGGE